MGDTIFLIQGDGELVELAASPDPNEAMFQSLLARYPNLLAGGQIDAQTPRRWLLVRREMGIPLAESGGDWMAVDHLFLDQDGIPTLVEVKRSVDTRLRREVVGQMLDYAANAVKYWPVNTIRERFEDACRVKNTEAEAELQEFLQGENDPTGFWQQVETNLRAGKLRLLFVADLIPPELQRIVEFLNEQMSQTEVLAVEIKKYTGAGLQTLVPRVMGQTAEAQRVRQPTSSKKWDEDTFFSEMESRHGQNAADIARKILEWFEKRVSYIWWGEGTQLGTFVPTLEHKGRKHQLFAVSTSGGVELYFQWYRRKPPFDNQEKLVKLFGRINQIPGVQLNEDALSRRPSISLELLAAPGALENFFETYSWYLDQVRSV